MVGFGGFVLVDALAADSADGAARFKGDVEDVPLAVEEVAAMSLARRLL